MSRAVKRDFVVGKVYPRSKCLGEGVDTHYVDDNIPFEILEQMDMDQIPLTSKHPPSFERVRGYPDIVCGSVTNSFMNKGDKWVICVVDTDNPKGVEYLSKIKEGEQVGMSLSHVYDTKSREYTPDHVSLVDKPRRPGCFVYHFFTDDGMSFDDTSTRTIVNKVNELPRATLINVQASDGSGAVWIEQYPTLSLGKLAGDPTMYHQDSHIKFLESIGITYSPNPCLFCFFFLKIIV